MNKTINSVSWLVGLVCLLILAGCRAGISPAVEGENEMTITITSTAFKEGEKIPRIFTCDDQNVSPPLSWTGVPSDTVSQALIIDDPDAPSGTWVHWVLYNMPASVSGLSQGQVGAGTEGKNDFGKATYGGPCPPRGSTHRYYVKLYALDIKLDLKAGASKGQVESAMAGHILAQGQLMGKYSR